MGISDLLALLTGGGGNAGAAAPAPVAAPPDAPAAAPPSAPAQGGVGAFLSDTDPGAPDKATPPAPYQVAPSPSAAAPPPGPSTPPSDQTDSGLSGFLSHMVQKATTRAPDTGMSFVDKLGKFGGQLTDMAGDTKGAAATYDTAAAKRVKDTQDEAQRQRLIGMARQIGMSPREQIVFAANPDEWVKANAGNLKDKVVGGGDTVLSPGQPAYTAPKTGQEGGEGYSVTPSGMTDLGGLQPSPQQSAQDDVKQAQQEGLTAYHQAMVRIAKQRADADTTRANKPRLGNGGAWLPAGAKVVGVGSQ
jgi:hypothetical protein